MRVADAVAQKRSLRVALLVAGAILPQVLLYGQSLCGFKLLLPLDVLAVPRVYLPKSAATLSYQRVVPASSVLGDQILVFEQCRRFAAAEFRAGRVPLWNPYIFAGTPFVFPSYSPFTVIYCLFNSPVSLAWIQLLKAVLAATGAYCFFRRVLGVGYWPAVLGAWCYPLTGFYSLWQGFYSTHTIVWLPWMLLAVDRTVREPARIGAPMLALVTALVLLSGQIDIAAQILLAAGLFALWCLYDAYGYRPGLRHAYGVATIAGAWLLGLMLAAPFLLPLFGYLPTGARMIERAKGSEDRPPAGLVALPQMVLPCVYGTMSPDSRYLGPTNNLLESPAATYTGLMATLLVAPIASCSPRQRRINCVLALLAFFTCSWVLNVPGFTQLFRLPGLNMMSGNRFVFMTSFALLSLAVVGMEAIFRGDVRWRWWFVLPIACLLLLAAWCTDKVVHLPEPVKQLAGGPASGSSDLDAVSSQSVQQSFTRTYMVGAVLCVAALCGWWLMISRWGRGVGQAALLAILLLGELLWFAWDLNPQSDPKWYFPRLPVLAMLAASPSGRVLGVDCLPPNLNEVYGLREVRGYDAVDPFRIVQVLTAGLDDNRGSPSHARTQYYVPRLSRTPEGSLRVPPVISMFNVRYLIFRGSPPPGVRVVLAQDDYWVVENTDALPRVFVPKQVEAVADDSTVLKRLSDPKFDPREIAFLNGLAEMPSESIGAGDVVHEVPMEITVALDMETAGLAVLSDQWNAGWHAYLNGSPAPILRTNYALSGVAVPSGQSTLVFRYEPASFVWGVRLMALALVILLVWSGLNCLMILRKRSSAASA